MVLVQNKYNAWKTIADGTPIDGTDRTLLGVSKRAVLKHLAFEEKVEYKQNQMSVICKDGTIWYVSKI